MRATSLLLTFCSLFHAADNAMIVTWGVPQPIASCQNAGGLAWKTCVQNCTDTFLCMVAATNLKGQCFWCKFKAIKSVTKSNSAGGWKVAFKVAINPEATSCPVGENAPTFNNVTVTGDLSTYVGDAYTRNYTLKFTGTAWTYTFYEKRRCNDSFYYFKRSNVEWCMGIFVSPTSGTYEQARDSCPLFSNSKLSGIASADERNYIIAAIGAARPVMTNKYTYVRIDGKRTTACQSTPKTATCMSPSGFTRVDKYVKNFNGVSWVTNSAAGASAGKQCMVTVFDGKNEGKQDFAVCDLPTDIPSLVILCGFVAF